MGELNWTDAQWQKVQHGVAESFGKANVATQVLPTYGPLPGSAEMVRNERLDLKLEKDPTTDKGIRGTVSLDSGFVEVNQELTKLTINVELSSPQVADETLSNAMLAFGRAANILARELDREVFDLAEGRVGKLLKTAEEAKQQLPLTTFKGAVKGPDVVTAVVEAIGQLEKRYYTSPFACVLDNETFQAIHDPLKGSFVLPADRMPPHLKGGPLLRCGSLNAYTGVVVSLAGGAIDIVMGTPPTVQFLQRREDAAFLFRVYLRFAVRIRDVKTPPLQVLKKP